MLVAVILALPSAIRNFEFRRHLSIAKELTNKPDECKTSAMCNRRIECINGDPFHLYFWSTNGGPGISIRSNYMVSVITFPDGKQFTKQENFDYNRSRAIADPFDRFTEDSQWLGVKTSASGYDMWDIVHAKDHGDLGAILENHGFNRYD